jgi:methylenetetrahydrofolate dehydrogenase (NADP+)/methenyltetrahydrofolate cyclohydrolase
MATVKFDGNKEAERMTTFLEESERVLGKSLIIFQCDGRADESMYVRLKREMGERLGVLVGVIFAKDVEDLKIMIEAANSDETVDGIMVQLPVMGANKEELEQILAMINENKDVDGLNLKSRFVPAVVRAVERVAEIFKISEDDNIALVGAKGSVGVRLSERLRALSLRVTGFDQGDDMNKLKDFDVIIGSTGASSLITAEMVADKFVGIDLGYPKPDFSPEAIEKASLITPVPGGVGPMTIVAMYENLADA